MDSYTGYITGNVGCVIQCPGYLDLKGNLQPRFQSGSSGRSWLVSERVVTPGTYKEQRGIAPSHFEKLHTLKQVRNFFKVCCYKAS